MRYENPNFKKEQMIGDNESDEILIKGKVLEKEMFEPFMPGWDGDTWIELRKMDEKDRGHRAGEMIENWLTVNNIMPVSEWRKISPEKKKMIIFDWVRKHEPLNWNPSEPVRVEAKLANNNEKVLVVMNRMADDLHVEVADKLEKLGLENYGELKFYTALGTPADTLYGSDGFMDFGDVTITIDITANKEKEKYGLGKADIIFRPAHVITSIENKLLSEEKLSEKKKLLAEEIKKCAKNIAELIQQRLKIRRAA